MFLPDLSTLTFKQAVKRTSQIGAYRQTVGTGELITQDMIDRIVKVNTNGECLYRCFIGITGMNMSDKEMRMIISNWIILHPNYFKNRWGSEMRHHLQKEGVLANYPTDKKSDPDDILNIYLQTAVQAQGMGTLTYGGDIEIDAFAQAYRVHVGLYLYESDNVHGARLSGQFSPSTESEAQYPRRQIVLSIKKEGNHYDYVGLPLAQSIAGSQVPAAKLPDASELKKLKAARMQKASEAQRKKAQQDMIERNRELALRSSQKPVPISRSDTKPPVPAPAPQPGSKAAMKEPSSSRQESELDQIQKDAEEAMRLQKEFDDESLVRQMENAELRRRYGQ